MDIKVWPSRVAAHTVTVDYATEAITTTEGTDYTAAKGTVTFAAGETRKTVSVPISNDAVEDSGETFRLVLSNPRCDPAQPCLVELLSSGHSRATILNEELVTIAEKEQEDGVQVPRPTNPHAALIAKVRGWRNDPNWVHDTTHTNRWDRVLLAFGETVLETSLTPMTVEEAQALADRGWQRWVQVAEALSEIEASAQQPLPQDQGQPRRHARLIKDGIRAT